MDLDALFDEYQALNDQAEAEMAAGTLTAVQLDVYYKQAEAICVTANAPWIETFDQLKEAIEIRDANVEEMKARFRRGAT